jgi:hypothetical protein
MSENLLAILLLTYFVLVILNLALSSKLVTGIKSELPEVWESFGKPKSLFMPSKNQLGIYKSLFLRGGQLFSGSPGLLKLNGAFCISTVLTHLSFAAFVIVFLIGG